MTGLTRRDAIKAQAAAAAALAAGLPVPAAAQNLVTDADVTELKWSKAPCRFCGTGCSIMVATKAGRVVATHGDTQAEVNRGLNCVKGYFLSKIMYGADRLTTPLLRKTNGEYDKNGDFTPVSWDEAFDIMAEKWKKTLAEKGPEGIGMFGSGQWTVWEGYAASKLMKAGFRSNNIDPNARHCMASAVGGFMRTFGIDEPMGCYDDFENADAFVLWGSNMAEMHPILWTRIADRRFSHPGTQVAVLSTFTHRSFDLADIPAIFTPQTDMVLLNAIANYIIQNDAVNKDFVGKHVNFRTLEKDKPTLKGEAMSFEDWKKALEPYTPDYVSEISGVSVEHLHLLADLFGDPEKRITSLWCMGVNQHTRGTAMNTLIHAVHLFSGHFGRPGDNPTSLTGQPSACGTAREVGTLAHALPGGRLVAKDEHRAQSEDFWNLPAGRINPKPGKHTVAMWKSWSTPKAEEGGEVHTIWVQVTNPGQTMPNSHLLIDPGVKDPDKFLICSDVYPTATTEIADLVLPSAMWVEKNGIFGNSERRTQQWFKQVEPPGDARDDVWQTIAVARELFERGFDGMKDKDGHFLFRMDDAQGREVPVWEWRRYYDINVDERLFEEYRLFSRLKHKDLAPYSEYVASRGLRWPVVQQDDGTWRETRFRFAEFDDPYVTKGAGHEFYHSTTGDGRAQVWFHPYTPPPEEPDGDSDSDIEARLALVRERGSQADDHGEPWDVRAPMLPDGERRIRWELSPA